MTILDDLYNFFFQKQQKEIIETGGKGLYTVIEIDLKTARTNKEYYFLGDRFIVQHIDSKATVRLNDFENAEIDLSYVRIIKTPFNKFYITNEAKEGKLIILLGSQGMFEAIDPNPIVGIDPHGRITEIGLDELAVRLGAPNLLNRSGQIIWFETFENIDDLSDHFYNSGSGAGHSETIIDTRSHLGHKCMDLKAGSDANQYAMIRKYLDCSPNAGKIGLEFYFNFTSNTDYLQITMHLLNGSREVNGKIKLSKSDSNIKIWGAEGWNTIASNVIFSTTARWFHNVKMVFDGKAEKFDRIIYAGNIYDISNYNLNILAEGGGLNVGLYFDIYHYGTVGNNPDVFIDNIIVTQKEV